MQPYIHRTANRLRIRSDFIRDNPKEVKHLVEKLQQIEGIVSVRHKKYAGSVALVFDSQVVDADVLMETVESHGWLRSAQRKELVENAVRVGTRSLCRGMAMMVLRKTLGPMAIMVVNSAV
ncbi:HMA2 domain-containing protein [uncultured Photobacterium sp.]|uniref:HMA2 domain-containing protein n=1 Tax=uncultured Photobacterium sp. TaxID=173973 RepID=UPI002635DB12|nr:hypothetical protein [uncultured Photobacterium sp.]